MSDDTVRNQRMYARVPVDMAGLMRLRGVRGGAYAITILDVSKMGLRVQCSRAMERGTQVEISCGGVQVFGEVRYSHGMGREEFHLGIEAVGASTHAGPQTGELDLMQLLMHR